MSTADGAPDRAWVEVDLGALRANARAVQAAAGAPLLPMVKANGYGLGAVAVARALEPLDPWGYGVAALDEAEELRAAGITRPLLVFCPLQPAQVARTRRLGVRPVVGDLAALEAWLAATTEPFHLEVDTGMRRAGLPADDAPLLARAAELVAARPDGFEGLFTHFHSAGHDELATREQFARFLAVRGAFPAPRLAHAANSAGAGAGRAYALDLVRPGIALYGVPTPGLAIRPVATLRAPVVAVRRVRAGEGVSYDHTWRAPADTRIATVAAGYADGVLRSLSNRGLALLGGRRRPMVGRITMDLTLVDVGEAPVQPGDVATLWGGPMPIGEQAALGGTIAYELLAAIGRRVPRLCTGA